MARGPGRLNRLIGGAEETAACARAYAALVGTAPAAQQGSLGANQMTRAALTARVLAARELGPLPFALGRQTDPADAAFLPPMGIHPVLMARDHTLVGKPNDGTIGWVDPWGWMGAGDGPAVTVWFGMGRKAWVIGRGPRSEHGTTAHQQREEQGLVIHTWAGTDNLRLDLHAWPVTLEGTTAFALRARLTLLGAAPRPVTLAFALRPTGLEGTSPVFELNRDEHGVWSTGNRPVLTMGSQGDQLLVGEEPWARYSGADPTGPSAAIGPFQIKSPKGLASAAEVFKAALSPGESLERFALVSGDRGPSIITASRLMDGARADHQGAMAAGAKLTLTQHQPLLEAARRRLLVDPQRRGVPALLGAVAMARLGFTTRAIERIGDALAHVRRDGAMAPGHAHEEGAVLCWAAAEVCRWTGSTTLVQNRAWHRLAQHLHDHPLGPGGPILFGPEGSERWSAIWRTAGLLAAARMFKGRMGAATWALQGGRLREQLPGLLGAGPWAAQSNRQPSGTSAAMLTAVWLGLVAPTHPSAIQTTSFLREQMWFGGGVLVQGGAHPALTALTLAVEEMQGTTDEVLGPMADLASPTGAWPTVVHPTRGALAQGDDLLSTVMFLLLVCERLHATLGKLTLRPGIEAGFELPTPFGRVNVEHGVVTGFWRGVAPRVTQVT